MPKSWFLLVMSILVCGTTVTAQWIACKSALPADVRAYRICAVNEKVVWAAGQRDYLAPSADFTRTTDGGETWQAGTIPMPADFFILNISAINADTAWAAVGAFAYSDQAGVYKTTDGGKSWRQQLNLIPWATFVWFFNAREGVSSLNPEINRNGYVSMFTTADGGESWTQVPESHNVRLAVDEGVSHSAYAVNGEDFYAPTSAGRILKSSDKGTSWSLLSTGSVSSFIWPSFKDPLHALSAVSTMEKHYEMRRTSDGGLSWEHVPSPDFLAYHPASIPGTAGGYLLSGCLWGLGKTGSAFTTDSGLTWTLIDDIAHLWTEMVSGDLGWGGCGTSNVIYKWSISQEPAIGVYPAANLNFPPTPVEGSSEPQTLAITNYGHAPLIVSGITLSGNNFHINKNFELPATLNLFETAWLEVLFAPKEGKKLNDELTIMSNSPRSPRYTFTLEGEGAATDSAESGHP